MSSSLSPSTLYPLTDRLSFARRLISKLPSPHTLRASRLTGLSKDLATGLWFDPGDLVPFRELIVHGGQAEFPFSLMALPDALGEGAIDTRFY